MSCLAPTVGSVLITSWRLRPVFFGMLLLASWGARRGSAAPFSDHLSFQRLTAQDGLPAAVVYCGMEDSRGFLWFGTADGVARFDGLRFRVFRPDPADPESLANGAVLGIVEDNAGNLWMATEGGLDLWNRDTERFTHFRHDPDDPASLSDDTTQSILLNRDGTLWIGTTRGGLSCFDPRSGKFERFGPYRDRDGGVNDPWIRCLFRDRQGVLWIGTGSGGLNRLDPNDRRIRAYTHDPADSRSLSHNRVSAIAEDPDGYLWVGTDGGLCRLDPARRAFERIHLDSPSDEDLPTQTITSLIAEEDGSIWFGTDGGGFCQYDPASRRFQWHRHSKYVDSTVVANAVRAAFRDRNGDLWIGHFPAGVSHLDRLAAAFEVFISEPGEANTLSDDNVLSFLEDPSGDLWVGTDNGGVNHWDAAERRWRSYRHSTRDPDSLGAKAAVCLQRDHQGQLWVGTWGGGLNRFEPETGTFRHYLPQTGRDDSLSDEHVWRVVEDHDRQLWIATIGGGVERYDRETDGFVHHRHDPANRRSLNDDIVCSMLVTRSGALWVGTPKGLARWDPATQSWDRFQSRPGDKVTLNGYWIFDLLEDRNGMIWATTEGGGLNRLDPGTRQCENWRMADGLSSDVLRGILEDDAGVLWIGSNQGLMRYDPQTRQVRVFDETNGLPGGQLNPHARLRLRSGEFLFGTTKGFVRFDPRSVPQNKRPPPVVFTEFSVFNQAVKPALPGSPLPRSITETTRLEIPARLSVISFQFAALSYRSPSRSKYRFMLEGFDQDWREPGSEHRATFTNLDPGHYRLRVKAANSDGVWNETGAAIDLIIVPPWWRTLWFNFAATLLVLGVAAAIGWAISNHLQRNRELASERERAREREQAAVALRALNQELELRVAERTSQLVTANKELEAFAYSVSHDLRAPLRHIDGFMELLAERSAAALDGKSQRYMKDISVAAKRMGKLIDDLLSFSRMGRRELLTAEVDVDALVHEIIQDFAVDLKDRQVEWKIEKLPRVPGDRSMLRVVFVNLISNAIKFTSPRELATIEIGSKRAGEETEFYVKDNGVGYDSEYAQKLFGVFQRLHRDDEFEGTGIGLANVCRIIERHGGRVWSEASLGQGATFYFSIRTKDKT